MSVEAEDTAVEPVGGSRWEGMSSKAVWNDAYFSAVVDARDRHVMRGILMDLDLDALNEMESHLELKSLQEQNASQALLSAWSHTYLAETAVQNLSNDKYSFVLSVIRSLPKK